MASTKDYAAELVLWFGVIGPHELLREVREAGLRAQSRYFDNLDEEFEGIVKVDDFYVSTDKESRIGKALRLLTELGVTDDDYLQGGIRRSLGASEMVPRVRRAEVAAKTLAVLRPFLETWRPLRRNEMGEDRALAEYLAEATGGVMKREDLEEWIRTNTRFEDGVRLTYSPVLEMVANGVFGIRGAEVDVAAVEALRNARPGPWSRWGRLDRQRIWIEVKTVGQQIRVRIPADCREALEERNWELTTIAGGQLGTLRVTGERSVHVEWAHQAPSDWTAGEHVAVLEFDTTHSRAKLLPGASSTDEFDHRLVDGCALINGRWQFTFVVDDHAAASGSVSIPRAVSGLGEIAYGRETIFEGDGGMTLTVSREPHACRVSGLGSLMKRVEVGSYIRLGFGAERCEIAVADPPERPADILSRYAGVFVTPVNLWPTIGKAMGISGADRQKVRYTLADRERFDLDPVLDAAANTPVALPPIVVPSSAFYVQNSTLLRHHGGEVLYAERAAGNGLFGLVWNSGSVSMTRDDTWANDHSWLSGLGAQLRLAPTKFSSHAWTMAGYRTSGTSQRFAMGSNSLACLEGELPLASIGHHEPMLPLKSLGYATAFSSAETRLRALRINAHGWTGFTHDGGECGPTPLRSLLAEP